MNVYHSIIPSFNSQCSTIALSCVLSRHLLPLCHGCDIRSRQSPRMVNELGLSGKSLFHYRMKDFDSSPECVGGGGARTLSELK